MHFLRPRTVAVIITAALLCGCAVPTSDRTTDRFVSKPQIRRILTTALSWPRPGHVDALVGARLFEDGPPGMPTEVAITHSILRANERIEAMPALALAVATVRAARRNGLPSGFLAATLLQESAFDPDAFSSAGAVGIAQFTIDTANDNGVDPFDPIAAIDGSALLLASYVRAYHSAEDPYSLALAAYNAGPGAVERYHGIPPYAETREYIQDIYERWGRIEAFEVSSDTRAKEREMEGSRK